mgnify:CR=1 FL=1
MELAVFLICSVAISNYLERRSRYGNIAFSVFFIFASSLYLLATPIEPISVAMTNIFGERIAIIRGVLNGESIGLSPMSVVRFGMNVSSIFGAIYFLGMTLSVIYSFIHENWSKLFTDNRRNANLSPVLSMRPVLGAYSVNEAPKDPIYLRFEVMRN